MRTLLSEREIEESVLDEDEKCNVSGYVDADGNCSFNGSSAPAVAASFIRNEMDSSIYGEEVEPDDIDLSWGAKEQLSEEEVPEPITNARISGDCCSLIGTAYHAKGGDVSNLRIHGDDVNITIETVSGMTELSATFLGDDSYNIEELDDGADIFSFDVGDVVSGDDIRMPLIKLALEE